MIDDSERILRITRDEGLVRDWELVLLAQGLSPRLSRTQDGIALAVPRAETERALAGLAAYEKENPPKPRHGELPMASINLPAGIGAGLFLLGFYIVTVQRNTATAWIERGSANAVQILGGEAWRAVTALTLHADAAHLSSNVFGLAVFLSGVAGQLGVGVGILLTLLAGAAGNLANSVLQGASHDSLGASTAVFGAVGIIGGLAAVRRIRGAEARRGWIAIAAALALLGMLGAGGGRVDVLAHLMGFLFGAVLGIFAGSVFKSPPGRLVQTTCGAAALGIIAASWALALR